MNVTSSIWGAPSSWTEKIFYNKAVGKVATFSNNGHTLSDAITSGNLTFNQPITDQSLSWCALGEESNYTKMTLFDADTLAPTAIKNEAPMNFFFYLIEGGYGAQNYLASKSDYKRILYNGYDPGQTWSNLNDNQYIQPIADFYIKKCVWRILVECVDTLSNNTISTYDFNDYKNNHMTSHPYILSIYAEPYFGEAGSRTELLNLSIGSCLNVAPFNTYSLFSYPIGQYFYQDHAITSADRSVKLYLFGSPQQNVNASNAYLFTLGNCKRQTTLPRRTYQNENLNEVLESALKTIACFGFYFCIDGYSHSVNDALDSEYIYMGVIPRGGITHGEYTKGAANRNNNNWRWNTSSDSDYDWTKPITKYDNNSTFNNVSIAAFNKMYAIQQQTARKLAKVLSNGILSRPSGTPIDEWLNDTFLSSNPLDTIVSLRKFPCTVAALDPTLHKIYFGAYSDENIKGMSFDINPPYFITQATFEGENMFKPEFEDSFLDYEPYTNVSLYIPFCGTVKIPVGEFMGHTINVKMAIDFMTGSVAAYVRRDNLNIISAQGTCSIDIPVSGIQGATLDSQIFQSSQNLRAAKSNEVFAKTAAFGSALNAAKSKNAGSILGTISQEGRRLENATLARQGAEYEISHVELPLKQVGGASPLTSQLAELCCRLIIERPVLSSEYDPEIYGKTVGFACLINGKVSDLTGYTEGAILAEGVPATIQEKEAIKNLFAGGVII